MLVDESEEEVGSPAVRLDVLPSPGPCEYAPAIGAVGTPGLETGGRVTPSLPRIFQISQYRRAHEHVVEALFLTPSRHMREHRVQLVCP